jgi:hypothetical protein
VRKIEEAMQITISEEEAEALLKLKKMFKTAATPTPEFLEWIAARLVEKCGDSDLTDYVQKTRQYAGDLCRVQRLLGVVR